MVEKSSLVLLILLVFLGVLLYLRKREKDGNGEDKPSQKSSRLSNQSEIQKNQIKQDKLANDERTLESFVNVNSSYASTNFYRNEDINIVSSENINRLEEYRVFKELGYFKQAAEILSDVIEFDKQYRQPEYISDLANLYIETQSIEKLDELLEDYSFLLEEEQLRDIVRKGFEIEPNNYRLQLVCTKILEQDPIELGAQVDKDS